MLYYFQQLSPVSAVANPAGAAGPAAAMVLAALAAIIRVDIPSPAGGLARIWRWPWIVTLSRAGAPGAATPYRRRRTRPGSLGLVLTFYVLLFAATCGRGLRAGPERLFGGPFWYRLASCLPGWVGRVNISAGDVGDRGLARALESRMVA